MLRLSNVPFDERGVCIGRIEVIWLSPEGNACFLDGGLTRFIS